MLKTFLLKKMMRSQLSKLPADQRALFEKLIDNNPDLLMQIAQDLQAELKTGKDQMAAMMVVMKKHEAAIKKALAS
jgi:hypothetical protein